jgi:hypothetical protein
LKRIFPPFLGAQNGQECNHVVQPCLKEKSGGWTLEKKCVKNSSPQNSSRNRIVLYELVQAL